VTPLPVVTHRKRDAISFTGRSLQASAHDGRNTAIKGAANVF
jgi:hypothetical protein